MIVQMLHSAIGAPAMSAVYDPAADLTLTPGASPSDVRVRLCAKKVYRG